MLRIRIDLAYDGGGFSGWAVQPERRTVEGELAGALTCVLRSAEPVRLTVAGRTDAGVHARGQVVHLDVDTALWSALPGRSGRTPEQSAQARLAGVLPEDVVVRAVRVVPAAFDARFAATHRRYSYRICDRPEAFDPRRRHDTVVVRQQLDLDLADAAAGQLVGLHDFAAFCRRRDGATTVRTLLQFSWFRDSENTAVATVVADAFCHSMVRALIGAIVPVAQGRCPPDWPRSVLVGGRRDPRVVVMPAHGLCLEEVGYPPDDQLATRVAQARAVRRLE
ncbi:MAG: tRNA pseudouridine(38-40) synthase TruA [Angustibacter sp.]